MSDVKNSGAVKTKGWESGIIREREQLRQASHKWLKENSTSIVKEYKTKTQDNDVQHNQGPSTMHT